MRRPLKMQALRKLLDLEVPISAVVDVGVLTGTGELKIAFPDKKHYLIEPIVEWNDTIIKSYGGSGIDFELINVAASDQDGVMNMETVSVVPGKPISHANLTEKPLGENVREVPVRTLNTLVKEYDIPSDFLLKLDVDGVELLILQGASEVLANCSVVVIEANVKTFMPRATFLANNGFELFDIVDPCYYDGRLRQVDIVFLNSRMVEERNLDMYKQAFEYAKWEAYK